MPAAIAHATPAAPPRPFERAKLLRGGLQVGALLAVLGLVAAFAPGLGEIRHHLAHADAGWVAAAVALQVLSCGSYVLLFRPLFHTHGERWASTQRIAWSALAIGSIVPASGAAGLAYGGWALTREGAEPATVARRSVAFFLIKGSVNFVAVAMLGTAMALGLFGPPVSLWLTAFPAALSTVAIVGVLLLPGSARARATRASRRSTRSSRPPAARSSPARARRSRSSAAVTRSCWPVRSATGSSTTRSCGPPSTPSAPTSTSP